MPSHEIRKLAAGQVARAKQSLEAASGVAWYSGLGVRVANHWRWASFRAQIEQAERALSDGDKEAADPDKKTRYVSAWAQASQALSDIASEADEGATDLSMVLDAGADKAVDEISEQASKAAKAINLTPLLWVGGAVLAFELVRR